MGESRDDIVNIGRAADIVREKMLGGFKDVRREEGDDRQVGDVAGDFSRGQRALAARDALGITPMVGGRPVLGMSDGAFDGEYAFRDMQARMDSLREERDARLRRKGK